MPVNPAQMKNPFFRAKLERAGAIGIIADAIKLHGEIAHPGHYDFDRRYNRRLLQVVDTDTLTLCFAD